jgi:trk system potassium uptake protein
VERRPVGTQWNEVFNIFRTKPWRILLPVIPKPRNAGSSSLILIYGFAAIIGIGTVLLALPIATKSGQSASVIDALFTATSAVCVTGLTVVDTADHWSQFGQYVIFALIQIGGFGFMTTATMFLLMFGRRIGLRERMLIGESLGMQRFGGMVRVVWQMAIFTVAVEVLGMVLIYFYTGIGSEDMPLWKSAFHSVSAFNNAGFDLAGNFNSLLVFQKDIPLLIIMAATIFLGGISFLVVIDVVKVRKFTRLSLDSKMVLSTTLLLLVLGTVIFLVTEFNNTDTFGQLSPWEKVTNALFFSVASRTAGFATVNLAMMADYTLFFMMILMFIGGASGSTAGGIKVNNFSMLITTVWSSIRGREHPGAFGREFNIPQIHRALSVVVLSAILIALVVFSLTMTDNFGFIDLLVETFSAFGTVGYSTGITPLLSTAGRLIIVFTMFVGRLGPLTLTLALVQRQKATAYRYPKEMVRIG